MWVHNASPEVDRASHYPRIISVCTVLTLFMILIVGLRTYVRARIVRAVGSDDYVTISAAVCLFAFGMLQSTDDCRSAL